MTRRVFLGALGVVSARLAWLQLIDGPSLASAAESQRTNTATLHAKRGTIYDRNGNILAMSVECETRYRQPSGGHQPSGVADLLVEHLGGEKSSYMELLTKDTTFVYVEQKVDQAANELSTTLVEPTWASTSSPTPSASTPTGRRAPRSSATSERRARACRASSCCTTTTS